MLPAWQGLVPTEAECGHLSLGDCDAGREVLAEQARHNDEAGRGRADVVEDQLPSGERACGLVFADFYEEAVLDRGVLQKPRRMVGDGAVEAVATAEATLQAVLVDVWVAGRCRRRIRRGR